MINTILNKLHFLIKNVIGQTFFILEIFQVWLWLSYSFVRLPNKIFVPNLIENRWSVRQQFWIYIETLYTHLYYTHHHRSKYKSIYYWNVNSIKYLFHYTIITNVSSKSFDWLLLTNLLLQYRCIENAIKQKCSSWFFCTHIRNEYLNYIERNINYSMSN